MLSQYLILCFVIIGAWASEDDVFNWTDGNFTQELELHENTVVMFYAPQCVDCERLKPEYAMAAELLRESDPPITLAKVDCTEAGKETCNKYLVSDYPTLKIFFKTELVGDYNGTNEARGIAEYMQSQVDPASTEFEVEYEPKLHLKWDEVDSDELKLTQNKFDLHTLERRSRESGTIPKDIPKVFGGVKVAIFNNFDEIVTNNGKDTLIAFQAPSCIYSQELVPILDELANKMANEEVSIVTFDATASEVPSKFKINGYPTLYWLKKDSKGSPVEYVGQFDNLLKYIAKHTTNELKSFDREGNPIGIN